MSRSRRLLVLAALAAPALAVPVAAASPASACTPSVSGGGPTVIVDADPNHPGVDYDSSNAHVGVTTCL